MKTAILVDGNCLVCDFEMSHYQKIAPAEFQRVDISDPSFRAEEYGLTAKAVNLHLHVRTPEGEILKGVPAFVHIWSRIPRYRFAGKMLQLPVIRQLAGVGYEVFVRIRPWLPKRKR